MRILHTFVRKDEDNHEAICRVAALAGNLGYDGYSVDCELCGQRLDRHDPRECTRQNLALELLDHSERIAL